MMSYVMTDTSRDICFVIPTYNEAGNMQAVLEQLTALDPAWQALIVDDESPDGTADLVESFCAECPRVQMDADFSHAPAEALRLIELARDGTAIGSRYVAKASIDAHWHIFRRWLSSGGNWLTRHIASIQGVLDCTSGFRAVRHQALDANPAFVHKNRKHLLALCSRRMNECRRFFTPGACWYNARNLLSK